MKKLKIVLISITYAPTPIMLIMHEMIKMKGHESYYIHVPYLPIKGKDDEGIKQNVDEIMKICYNADLIAFTCMTNTFMFSVDFIREMKKRKNIPIAMGGIHATAKPMECLNYVEYVCIGEGENAFMELIDRMSNGKKTTNIPGFYVKLNGKIIKNMQGSLIHDLDTLPIPSFNLKEYYFMFNNKLICMEEYKNDQNMLQQYFSRWYFTITSRGCPYKCKFCINDVLKRMSPEYYGIRKRSPEHIMKELVKIKELIKYPIIIGFADDDFFARSTEEMEGFAKLYKEKIGLPFFCSSTPHSMKEEKIKCVVEAGLYRLEIGIQSINDKTNWEIHGRAGLKKDVVRAINIASPYRHKIKINYDIMLDNPWETEKSELETIEFMFEIPKPCTFAIFSLLPFPGTSQYERAKKEGKLEGQEKIIYKNDIMLLKNSPINTLATLYAKYKVPSSFVKFLIKTRKIEPFKSILSNSTVPLWRLYNYYEGLKASVEDKNYAGIKYYLTAPALKLLRATRQSLIPKRKEGYNFTIESLEKGSGVLADDLPKDINKSENKLPVIK